MLTMRTFLQPLAATALVLTAVHAETVQFFYNQEQDTCNWGSTSIPATNNTANGGLCAYVSSITRVYACPAPDAACWNFGQTCTANNGTDPGGRQIQCNHAGSIWCCQNEETCTVTKDQINVCVSQFSSPNSGVTVADAAAKEFSVVPLSNIPTTAVKSTPSVIKTATFVVATAGTTIAKTTSTSGSAQSTQSASASSTGDVSASSSTPQASSSTASRLSGGAIAGIVIGVLAALGVAASAVAYLLISRRRKSKVSYMPPTQYYEVPGSSTSETKKVMGYAGEGQHHGSRLGIAELGRSEVEVRHELQ